MEERKSRVWILVGPPASGKSTWAASKKDSPLFSNDVHIVSRDQVRYSLVKESEPYFSKETLVFNTFADEIIKSIKNHKDTIVDATNVNLKSRRKLFNRILPFIDRATVEFNAVFFVTPLEFCLQRNSTRKGRARVPDSALTNIFNSYQEPTYAEGFTNVYSVKCG